MGSHTDYGWMPHMRPGSVGSDQLDSKMVQRNPEPETSDGGSGREWGEESDSKF